MSPAKSILLGCVLTKFYGIGEDGELYRIKEKEFGLEPNSFLYFDVFVHLYRQYCFPAGQCGVFTSLWQSVLRQP